MVIKSRHAHVARIAATLSVAGALACGIGSVAPSGAAAAEVPHAASSVSYSSVESGSNSVDSASAVVAKEPSVKARYQCITRDNTPLWYNGAILRWTNAGQGLYDLMDFGDQRIWARLWGGGSISYQIDRWNVGWCG
ncbi:hypothetical protein [Amycolatopsis sp. lyj-108]|uniref:hypothetical protein n=1 Tax=Amycolatopsis sp. lyj-108 TaxID=2789286 RepID=UPI00397B6C5B